MDQMYTMLPDAATWQDGRPPRRGGPRPKDTTTTEAAPARYDRHRQAKWDREQMRTISTRVTVEEDRQIRRACWHIGRSRHWVVQRLLRAWMAEGGPMLRERY